MSSHTRVLVVDADDAGATTLLELLGPAGYVAHRARGLDEALDLSSRMTPDVVVLALDVAGLAGVTQLASATVDAQLVLLARESERALAREGLRLGACDVVQRGAEIDVLLFSIERAAREGRTQREVALLRARASDEARLALVGRSVAMERARELVGRAAGSRITVLVTGEQGTGKDVVARMVHDLSDRAARPFVMIRCGGADAEALGRELFGESRGGVLEAARGGTLVLDDVSALPRLLRARLARMLAERVVHRDSGSDAVPVDVRLVLTARIPTEEPMPAAIAELVGERNVLPIALPPLRERRADIPMLVQHFRARLARETGAENPALSSETTTALLSHQWPGNVRELEHWVERTAYAASAERVTNNVAIATPGSDFAQLDSARLTLDALERKYILHVLEQEQGHQSRAAERLGIDRRTLYRKLKEYREAGVALAAPGMRQRPSRTW